MHFVDGVSGFGIHRPRQAELLGDNSVMPPSHVRFLQCISVAFASLSFLSTLYSFYWFVRMRRTFRHE